MQVKRLVLPVVSTDAGTRAPDTKKVNFYGEIGLKRTSHARI